MITGRITLSLPPSRDNRRWPAVMLAVRRIARVNGRITLLSLSINTRKGIRGEGVLIGTRWRAILLKLNIQPNSWDPNHRGIDRNREKDRCLEAVKI